MLSHKERKAVRLLFEMPEERVAQELGVQMDTLRRWKGRKEFVLAMQTVAREARESACRILLGSLSNSAAGIFSLTAANVDGTQAAKADPKLMVDLLKASGLLEAALQDTEPEDRLAAILGELAAKKEQREGSVVADAGC